MQARTQAGVLRQLQTIDAGPGRCNLTNTETRQREGGLRTATKGTANSKRVRTCKQGDALLTEVRTRVFGIADQTETCTYLRITGSPFCCCCCCDILTVTCEGCSDWTVCAWLTDGRSRPCRRLKLVDRAYGSAARQEVRGTTAGGVGCLLTGAIWAARPCLATGSGW
jgi:hypothetical protein